MQNTPPSKNPHQRMPQGKVGDLEVVVLQSRCIGAAICVAEAQGSFELNATHKAVVTDLTKNKESVLIDAARNCPTQAIYIYKNKKQIWPPAGTQGQKMQPGTNQKMGFEQVE
jgi:ferredoxin